MEVGVINKILHILIWFTINILRNIRIYILNHITIYILQNMRQKCEFRGFYFEDFNYFSVSLNYKNIFNNRN